MAERLRFWLKTSRPGLWFPTVWLYALPLAGAPAWEEPAFWLGLALVTFPLNFVIYGVNDLVDRATDRLNPRKDSWLFGARGSDGELRTLPGGLAGAALGLGGLVVAAVGPMALPGLALLAALLWAYNHPTRGLRGQPPWELSCQAGYLLVVPFSAALNGAPLPTWPTFVYLALFAVQSQLIGEVMDIEPDRRAGRRTSATALGLRGAKAMLAVVVGLEVALLVGLYRDVVLGGVLAAGLCWLVLDAAVLFRDRPYSLPQMRIFGLGANVVALASMAWVWWSGCLQGPP